ncbi:MAG TPA: MOSC N-terminal beta barrel domain-containing protein [Candidatus Dormibacteraeota bacterium]|nr:MOSC N-terminal beta barrel domain-containing protein [Candidatus Dormibacteraeota bacterium]
MTPSPVSPRLANISLYPIKSLDPMHVKEARIGPSGGLEFDRAWALYSADGQWVNGKRSAAVHLIRAVFAPDISSVTLSVPGDRRKIPTKTFAFPGDTASASKWFCNFFEQPITVRHAPEGFPDDTIANGPTIISTASLQAVCGLFPGMTIGDARLRFRTTLEIDGDRSAAAPAEVPAFWEDQLFGAEERSAVRFRIGEVNFEGSHPCVRCPVPPRDPHTGVIIPSFQKIFSDYRRSHVPAWCPEARFDHYYRLATNTRVASSEAGKILRVGDLLVL